MSPRHDRVRLHVHPLEAREVPAMLTSGPGSAAYDPTHVLVSFADGGREAAHAGDLARSPFAADVTALGLGVYRVDLAPGITVGEAVPEFAEVPGATASPDFVLTATRLPNDPGVNGAWQYANTGAVGGVAGADIDAAAGWAVARGTGRTVVAVIDSGIDYTHPDLAANLWRNPGEVPGNGRDDDRNGFVDDVFGADFANNDGDPRDDLGHGTHVAGSIGAVGNNGRGVTGVAWTTRLMALKFMAANGDGATSAAVRAIDYAIANGAKVVNASWGGGAYNPALEAAIGRARAAGVVFVAAAGNTGANNDAAAYYPAGYISKSDNVVTVAATDRSDKLAGFSNFGQRTVTLAAPGVSINSTLPNGRYAEMSGTSMAAPQVAGAIAVLWDANPTWTYQQVIARLKASVDVLPSLVGKTQTGGRLNLAKLLGAPTAAPPPPVVSVPPTPAPTPTPPTTPPAPAVPTTAAGPKVVAGGFSGPKVGVFDRAVVTFDRSVDPGSFTAADVTVSGPGGAVGVSAVVPVTGSNNTRFYLMFGKAQTAAGAYSLGVGPDVRDSAGRRMDQNGNGVGGETADRFTTTAGLGNAVMKKLSVADLTGDGYPDAIATPATGSIVVVSGGGTPAIGFARRRLPHR